MTAPAPTWRTHDWCASCGIPVVRNPRGTGHAHDVCLMLYSHEAIIGQRILEMSPAQRAAFEAWAK